MLIGYTHIMKQRKCKRKYNEGLSHNPRPIKPLSGQYILDKMKEKI
jgi:hypothetical protein